MTLAIIATAALLFMFIAMCSVSGRCSLAEEQRDARLVELDRRIREREQLEQRLAAERRVEFERRFRRTCND